MFRRQHIAREKGICRFQRTVAAAVFTPRPGPSATNGTPIEENNEKECAKDVGAADRLRRAMQLASNARCSASTSLGAAAASVSQLQPVRQLVQRASSSAAAKLAGCSTFASSVGNRGESSMLAAVPSALIGKSMSREQSSVVPSVSKAAVVRSEMSSAKLGSQVASGEKMIESPLSSSAKATSDQPISANVVTGNASGFWGCFSIAASPIFYHGIRATSSAFLYSIRTLGRLALLVAMEVPGVSNMITAWKIARIVLCISVIASVLLFWFTLYAKFLAVSLQVTELRHAAELQLLKRIDAL